MTVWEMNILLADVSATYEPTKWYCTFDCVGKCRYLAAFLAFLQCKCLVAFLGLKNVDVAMPVY